MTDTTNTRKIKSLSLSTVLSGVFVISLLASGSASATEGYFSHGFGARNSALAGAGVADSRDAMSIAINPAGLVDVGRQFNGSVTLFAPFREYTATGTGFVAPGNFESDANIFAIPNFGYSHPVGPDSVIGISLFGNGGMNTTYDGITNLSPACTGASGVFCGGNTGVDLNQAFISLGYAKRFDKVSIGVAPIIGVQLFKAKGLAAFSGASSSPTNLTNRGYSASIGFGARVGIQIDMTDSVRFGASYQSKIYMNEFSKYKGLFANGGDFDVPSNFTVGLAIDATPDLTFLFDYKRIQYSDVGAISNSSAITGPAVLGTNGGPGFGWSDINIYKIGVEWRQNDQWTWRAGYAYNDNPLNGSDVTLNILAPGLIQHHFTGGGSYKYNETDSFDFAVMYAPESSVSGQEVTSFGPTPGSNIRLDMTQFAVTVGWSRKW